MITPVWILIVLMCLGVALVTFITIYGTLRWKAFFRSRPVIPFEEWYNHHYASASIPAGHVRTILDLYARELGVAGTQLLPSDRLDVELSYRTILDHFFEDSFFDCVLDE